MTWYLVLITHMMVQTSNGPALAQVCHYKTDPEQKWEDRRFHVVPPSYVCPKAYKEKLA